MPLHTQSSLALVIMIMTAAGTSAAGFAGTWQEGPVYQGYGGQFAICEDGAAGVAQGFYSETGYARGAVLDAQGVRSWSGSWFEPGNANDLSNWGGFAVQLAEDGQSFNGTWNYASNPAENFIWDGSRLSGDVPENKACMATNTQGLFAEMTNDAANAGFTLHGSWLGDVTNYWHTCVVNGNFRASYSYNADGQAIRGYISGESQLSGQVLMGDYWEEGNDHGLFILGLMNNREMMSTYWMADTLDDIDISKINDFDTHAVQFSRRISTDVTWAECSKNYAISEGRAPSDDEDDDDDISVDGPSGKVIALSVLLAVFSATTIAGGVFYMFSNKKR